MTTRRSSGTSRTKHELPPVGTADIRIIAADGATAKAVLDHLAERFPVLSESDPAPAGPSNARTGTRVYIRSHVAAAPQSGESTPPHPEES